MCGGSSATRSTNGNRGNSQANPGGDANVLQVGSASGGSRRWTLNVPAYRLDVWRYAMAVPTSPLPVCRFVGLLAGSQDQLATARFELAQWYGKIDDASDVLPFTFTQYYDGEMGKNLLRQWVRFEALFNPEHLAKCKLETNMAETLLARQFADKGAATPQRPVNIDPGYVHRYKVILATTKDHSHRVYIAEGIFAEVTLHWH
jgi:hypothetical protein